MLGTGPSTSAALTLTAMALLAMALLPLAAWTIADSVVRLAVGDQEAAYSQRQHGRRAGGRDEAATDVGTWILRDLPSGW